MDPSPLALALHHLECALSCGHIAWGHLFIRNLAEPPCQGLLSEFNSNLGDSKVAFPIVGVVPTPCKKAQGARGWAACLAGEALLAGRGIACSHSFWSGDLGGAESEA